MSTASVAHPGIEVLRAAKAAASSDGPALGLPVGRPIAGLLRPVVTRRGAVPAADVRCLTEWRNRYVDSFLSEFVATEERTERWLVESVGPDDTRILFMLDDAGGRTVGYMGLAFIDWATGYAEFDAIVRGADAPRGLVTEALRTLWAWGRGTLGLSRGGIRVRSNNPAVVFFERFGFRELRRVPLRRQAGDGGTRWREDPSGDADGLSLVHMQLEEDSGRGSSPLGSRNVPSG